MLMNCPADQWKPELLAPAKNLERLKVAIAYGADAVYLGGQKYGLRARADNFTDDDLRQGVAFAHQHNAKVYVTLNAFLHDTDFAGLEEYGQFLEAIGVDGVIVSDLGVLRVIRRCSNLNIHLSTQASCINTYAAQLWKQTGVTRLIVGRELTIAEAGTIRETTGMEVEMFTHGAMCMAYSGHCTISNFTAGRDSNRGGCIQSCRLPYHLQLAPSADASLNAIDQTSDNSDADRLVMFMSSRDLWGIYQIGDFFKHQICSLKIEGRMKSSFYVALTCKVYRRLIDACAAGQLTPALLEAAAAELRSVPHRDYFSGSLDVPASGDSTFTKPAGINVGTQQYVGIVMDTTSDQLILRLTEPLAIATELELIPFQGEPIRWQVNQLFSITGEPRQKMRQDTLVRIPKPPSMLRSPQPSCSRLNVVRVAAPVPALTPAF